MSSFSIQSFAKILEASLPRAFAGKLCVAFSGGVDSSVLLHAVALLRSEHSEWSVRAIHIDHQLQSASGDWAAHCKRAATNLGVELTIERVVISREDPHGLEAAARNARYSVFRRALFDGEVLLTAHHADDQTETVFLALMRGSGVQGLAAMPAIKAFSRGWHLRPMLGFTRNAIDAWAREQSIQAINDPSNAQLRHDRNYLRHQVLPVLQQRWSNLNESVGRSASHLGEALQLLEELAIADLSTCAVGRCLRIDALRELTAMRRRNLLRYWLRLRGLPLPSTRKLVGLEHDLLNTDLDRMPCVTWKDAELHWHRGLLYADSPTHSICDTHLYEQQWCWREAMVLPADLGRLSLIPTSGDGLSAARLPEKLTIRFRRGGEKIRLPGRRHRHALRNFLQENDVLPWWRDRLPLIFHDRHLLAVGNLAWSDDFAAAPGELALRVAWEGEPEWRAVTRDA